MSYYGGPLSKKERRRIGREKRQQREKLDGKRRYRRAAAIAAANFRRSARPDRTPGEMAKDLLDSLEPDNVKYRKAAFGSKYMKAVAYRFSRAVTIISEMSEQDASEISLKYREVVGDLKQSGLYEALVNRRKGLAEQIADFEKKISNIQIDTGPRADLYSDEQDLTYPDGDSFGGHNVRTPWHL